MARAPGWSWSLGLFVGLGLAVGAGVVAAAVAPSEGASGRFSAAPGRLTGTVVATAPESRSLTVEVLVAYDPVQAGPGRVQVTVPDDVTIGAEPVWSHLRPDETIDLELRADGGRWIARSITVLDPD